jgi:hypothetical protein
MQFEEWREPELPRFVWNGRVSTILGLVRESLIRPTSEGSHKKLAVPMRQGYDCHGSVAQKPTHPGIQTTEYVDMKILPNDTNVLVFYSSTLVCFVRGSEIFAEVEGLFQVERTLLEVITLFAAAGLLCATVFSTNNSPLT